MIKMAHIMLVILFICGVFMHCDNRIIYVSTTKAKDTKDCGAEVKPCRSIKYSLGLSKKNDKIHIDSRTEQYYEEDCNGIKPIHSNIDIYGFPGNAVVQCKVTNIKGTQRFIKLLALNNSRVAPKATISNITFIHVNKETAIICYNFNLIIQDFKFEPRYKSSTYGSTYNMSIAINASMDYQATHLYNSELELTVQNSNFTNGISLINFHNRATLNGTSRMKYKIHTCIFEQHDVMFDSAVTSSNQLQVTDMEIHKSSFVNSDITIDIFTKKPKSVNSKEHKFEVNIDRCHLFNKESGVFIRYNTDDFSLDHVSIKNSIFNNIGSIGGESCGGAITVTSQGVGHRRNNNSSLVISNSQFHNNSAPYGAAICSNNMNAVIKNCTFKDNRALSGSVVYSSGIFGWLNITDAIILHTKIPSKISQGGSVVYYSHPYPLGQKVKGIRGGVVLRNMSMTIFINESTIDQSFENPIFLDIADKVIMTDTYVQCPQGYFATSVMKLTKKARRKHSLSQNEVYLGSCQQCDVNTYSTEYGHIYNGNYTNDIQCKFCPLGAECRHYPVHVKKGYWAYIDNNTETLKVIACPSGYCCNKETCPLDKSCSGNRTGTLCGKCKHYFTEVLFSSTCHLKEHCNISLFWQLGLLYVFLYFLFFMYYTDVVSFIIKEIYVKKHDPTENEQISLLDNADDSQMSTSGGYVKIAFYFYQTASLLTFKDYAGGYFHQIQTLLQNVFSVEVAGFIGFKVCPFQSLNAIGKILIKLLPLCGLLILLFVVYVAVRKNCSVRICKAFTRVMLLSYATQLSVILSLTKCVSVGDKQVLLIYGDLVCYKWWQTFIFVYASLSVFVFWLYIPLIQWTLRDRKVSIKMFVLGCFLPLPVIIWCLLKTKMEPISNDHCKIKAAKESILEVLENPFRKVDRNNSKQTLMLSWQAVIIFRQLLIVGCYTYIESKFMKYFAICLICFIVLCHHLKCYPFNTKGQNRIETVSLFILFVFSQVQLIETVAYNFTDRLYEPYASWESTLKWFELICLLMLPLIMVVVITLSLMRKFIKLLIYCYHSIKRRKTPETVL